MRWLHIGGNGLRGLPFNFVVWTVPTYLTTHTFFSGRFLALQGRPLKNLPPALCAPSEVYCVLLYIISTARWLQIVAARTQDPVFES